MARKPKEWEEEVEDEEEEEEESDEELVDRFESIINQLLNERSKYDPIRDPEIWDRYTALIQQEQGTLRDAEAGRTDRATREDMHRHRFDMIGQIIGNAVVQGGIELIKSGFNRKNVKTITKCEDNGDIV